ncbi:hypothetical protein NM688_g7047 [Phlebia brevispora]|uniref:Uncharacterized protein n=1 Tax=Phlebia brevispora TaxID=194682 RepID=A0ACC1S9H1_9APHY|nr:hypothetical protein NM688_g7047 [Phlebia brevispora]
MRSEFSGAVHEDDGELRGAALISASAQDSPSSVQPRTCRHRCLRNTGVYLRVLCVCSWVFAQAGCVVTSQRMPNFVQHGDMSTKMQVAIECIWRPNSWVKWIFAFMRYAPILHEGFIHPLYNVEYSVKACQGFIAYQFSFMLVLSILVEAVLLVRVFALYNENKLLGRLLVALFAIEIIVCIVILAITVPRQTFTPNCEIQSSPTIFIAYWITSLTFETVLFVMTLIKFFQYSYVTWERGSILFVFFRDGTWAFAMIFTTILLNTVMYQVNNNPLSGAAYIWMCSVLSLAGSHVLLNIRRLGTDEADFIATTEHLTTITFGTSPNDRFAQLTGRSATTDESTVKDSSDTDDLECLPLGRRSGDIQVEV